MLFLYSRFIVNSLSLSFSPQLMRRGAEIPEIAFQMISCFVKSKYFCEGGRNILPISLLNNDIQQYLISISMKAMPSMFFDAFTVFARLSVPFCQCEISKAKDAELQICFQEK